MSTISSSVITKNLHKTGLSFHEVDVGPGQTYNYGGTGSGVTFDVHGKNTSHHLANAQLDLTLGSPGFVGTVKQSRRR